MEETAENKLMYTGAEIHPVVEIENPVLNTMYHITGNMALDHSVTSIVQAGGHFYEWMNHSDDLGVPDYGNAADDVWHMDAGDVNPVHGADDVADVNTGHVGQANAGGVTHLDDADNVAGVNAGCAKQQANAGGVTHLDDADNVAGVNAGCAKQQVNAGGVTHLDDADNVAGVSAGCAKQQVNAGGVTHLDDADNVAGVSAGRAQQQANVAKIKNGSKTIKSTLGNDIDVTPSPNHSVVNKNPGPYGIPNTSVDILDADGNIKTRRWYDSDGKAYRDVDMSDHGNPKEHPEVPHEHIWEYNNGRPERN